jgi:hypothetical protein
MLFPLIQAEERQQEQLRKITRMYLEQGNTIEQAAEKLNTSTENIRQWGSISVRSISDLTKLPLNRLFQDISQGMIKFNFASKLALGTLGTVAYQTFKYWDNARAQVNQALLPLQQQLGLSTSRSVFGEGGSARGSFASPLIQGALLGFSTTDMASAASALTGMGRMTRNIAPGISIFDKGATEGTGSKLMEQSIRFSAARGASLESATQLVVEMFNKTGRTIASFGETWDVFLSNQEKSILSSQQYTDATLESYRSVYLLGGGMKEATQQVNKFQKGILEGTVASSQVAAMTGRSFFAQGPGAMAGQIQLAARMGVGGIDSKYATMDPMLIGRDLREGRLEGLSAKQQVELFGKMTPGMTAEQRKGAEFFMLGSAMNLPLGNTPKEFNAAIEGIMRRGGREGYFSRRSWRQGYQVVYFVFRFP